MTNRKEIDRLMEDAKRAGDRADFFGNVAIMFLVLAAGISLTSIILQCLGY